MRGARLHAPGIMQYARQGFFASLRLSIEPWKGKGLSHPHKNVRPLIFVPYQYRWLVANKHTSMMPPCQKYNTTCFAKQLLMTQFLNEYRKPHATLPCVSRRQSSAAPPHLKKLAGLPGAGLCAKNSPPPSLATTQLESLRAGVPRVTKALLWLCRRDDGEASAVDVVGIGTARSEALRIICSNTCGIGRGGRGAQHWYHREHCGCDSGCEKGASVQVTNSA